MIRQEKVYRAQKGKYILERQYDRLICWEFRFTTTFLVFRYFAPECGRDKESTV